MEWDMNDFQEKEILMPSFIGIERQGIYVDGVFVNLEEQEKKANQRTPLSILQYNTISYTNITCILKLGIEPSFRRQASTKSIVGTRRYDLRTVFNPNHNIPYEVYLIF